MIKLPGFNIGPKMGGLSLPKIAPGGDPNQGNPVRPQPGAVQVGAGESHVGAIAPGSPAQPPVDNAGGKTGAVAAGGDSPPAPGSTQPSNGRVHATNTNMDAFAIYGRRAGEFLDRFTKPMGQFGQTLAQPLKSVINTVTGNATSGAEPSAGEASAASPPSPTSATSETPTENARGQGTSGNIVREAGVGPGRSDDQRVAQPDQEIDVSKISSAAMAYLPAWVQKQVMQARQLDEHNAMTRSAEAADNPADGSSTRTTTLSSEDPEQGSADQPEAGADGQDTATDPQTEVAEPDQPTQETTADGSSDGSPPEQPAPNETTEDGADTSDDADTDGSDDQAQPDQPPQDDTPETGDDQPQDPPPAEQGQEEPEPTPLENMEQQLAEAGYQQDPNKMTPDEAWEVIKTAISGQAVDEATLAEARDVRTRYNNAQSRTASLRQEVAIQRRMTPEQRQARNAYLAAQTQAEQTNQSATYVGSDGEMHTVQPSSVERQRERTERNQRRHERESDQWADRASDDFTRRLRTNRRLGYGEPGDQFGQVMDDAKGKDFDDPEVQTAVGQAMTINVNHFNGLDPQNPAHRQIAQTAQRHLGQMQRDLAEAYGRRDMRAVGRLAGRIRRLVAGTNAYAGQQASQNTSRVEQRQAQLAQSRQALDGQIEELNAQITTAQESGDAEQAGILANRMNRLAGTVTRVSREQQYMGEHGVPLTHSQREALRSDPSADLAPPFPPVPQPPADDAQEQADNGQGDPKKITKNGGTLKVGKKKVFSNNTDPDDSTGEDDPNTDQERPQAGDEGSQDSSSDPQADDQPQENWFQMGLTFEEPQGVSDAYKRIKAAVLAGRPVTATDMSPTERDLINRYSHYGRGGS